MKIIRKFGDARHGWRGLMTVWREEWHFKYQVLFALLALAIAYGAEATVLQTIILICALSMALGAEVINTVVEDICNYVQPDFDVRIGTIKDMAQAFVLVSGIPSVVVIFWIIWPLIP